MKKEELANYIRESVAGAARLLWLAEPTRMMQEALKCEAGISIVAGQAIRHLKESNPDAYSNVTGMEYATFAAIRRRIASAAKVLYVDRGTDAGWLIGARPSQIIDCAEVFSEKARTYTLDDLRKAYRAGHLNTWASGDGPGVDSQEWTQERDEALARI